MIFTKKITAFKGTGTLENLKSESDGNLIIAVFYKYISALTLSQERSLLYIHIFIIIIIIVAG